MQVQLACRARCSGIPSQVGALKVVALEVESKASAPQGEAGNPQLPPPVAPLIVWHCTGVGVYGECVSSLSHLFRCGHFLSHLACRCHSAGFWISLRGNCSLFAVHLVHLREEESLGASCVTIVDPSLASFNRVLKCSVSCAVL